MEKTKAPSIFQKRTLKNKNVKFIVSLIAVTWSLFQLVVAVFSISTNSLVAIHVSFGLAIGLIIYPIKTESDESKAKKYLYIDALLAFLGVIPGIYICIFQQDIMMRFGEVIPVEYFLGVIIIILVIELGRRVMGWLIISIALLGIAYSFWGNYIPGVFGHRGFNLARVVSHLYLTMEGIYTVPIVVSASFVYLFILFGSFLQSCGGGTFFIKLASCLLGRFRGGPAKISVLSSTFMGMVSGSAVANVAVTGSFTIPLMKRTGFKPHMAAAIEAAVSNGGQFMPPIMGAAAFIIPNFIGLSYFDVVKAAFVPGFLYFLAMFFMVDFESVKMNLKGLGKDEVPSLKETLKEGGHLLVPVIVLIYFLAVVRTSPQLAAFWATIALVALSMVRKSTRMSLKQIFTALENSAYAAIVVVSACALGGIIVGCIMLTGLGMSLSGILIDLAHGSLLLLLILAMIASLILGMGMTTTACYIILAILVGPALIKVGVLPIAAHLFIFYFGIVSSLTPPVALSAYAAAGIAGSDPTRTGFASFRIGLPAFILPYMFVFGPSLLLEGSLLAILVTLVTAIVGVYSFAAGVQGYMLGNLNPFMRFLMIIVALLLIFPGLLTDSIGSFILILIIIFQTVLSKRVWATKKQPLGSMEE